MVYLKKANQTANQISSISISFIAYSSVFSETTGLIETKLPWSRNVHWVEFMISLVIYAFHCVLYFVVWLNQRKPRKLVISKQKWILSISFPVNKFKNHVIYLDCYFSYRGHDHMIAGFTWRGILDTTLCDKVCQWLATSMKGINNKRNHELKHQLLLLLLPSVKTYQFLPIQMGINL
jgi:hypothetical protein